jgi:hypothetical protein
VNIGFFLVDTGTVDSALGIVCATALMNSARQAMPHARVVQFTDEQSPSVAGVDEVRRLPVEPMALLRMKHHASVTGEWLFVDSDVYFQHDVTSVFEQKFDVALTTRDWPHLKKAQGFSDRMPFNVGVVFSRSHKFWRDVYKRVADMPKAEREWMGDQQAICDMVTGSRYRFAFLKGSRYNFPPSMDDSKASNKLLRKALIVHYKGPERKALLLNRLNDESCDDESA